MSCCSSPREIEIEPEIEPEIGVAPGAEAVLVEASRGEAAGGVGDREPG